MNLKEELKSKVLLPIKEAGFKAFFVGGCVRDMLMGIEPHDFDITTNATPEELHKIFSSFSNVSNNSEPFGVTMPLIKFSDGTVEEIEIATFRKDITKGRHPKIEFTTSIQEDAERRDFTVNAIYEDADGNIIDPVKGADDIKANTLRFIGNAQDRISEDPLRVFRFVRFLASKGFKSAHGIPECMTWKADFDDVSKERILKELEKTFGGKFLFSGEITPFMFFMACGIHHKIGMAQLMVDMSNIEQSWMWHSEGSTWIVDGKETLGDEVSDFTKAEPLVHGNVWDHVIRVMELMSEKTQSDPDEHHRFIMMMSAFLHDIGKAHSKLGVKHNDLVFNGRDFSEDIPKVSDHDVVGAPIAYEFCKSLGMTNDDCEFVRAMTENHMKMHQLVQMKSPAKIWQFIKNTPFDDLIVLAECDENGCIKASNDEWDGILRSLERKVQVFTSYSSLKVKIDELRKMDLPKPVLTGDDLIQFGKKPGPVFKKILQKAFEFQIDSGIYEKERLYNLTKGIQLKATEK